jgi:glucose-6-phosphate isomerase
MFPKINPTETGAWKLLTQHAEEMKQVRMKDLFAQDADRFKKFSHTFNDIVIDFSKNIITSETLK